MTAPALFAEEPPEREDPMARLALRVLWWVIAVGVAVLAVAAGYTFEWWGP